MTGGTNRTLTVLFTDVVGSTELRARLGDAAADALQRAHDAVAASAADDHRGELVKGTGDGVLVVFESATDAIGASVDIQLGVARATRERGEPIAVRIGLSTGDVAFRDGDVHGTPVVEAARLCDAADAGQILCSDITRVLAGSRVEVPLSPVGALELKGLPAPVVAHAVTWEEPSGDRIPLPTFLGAKGAFSFVGREEECAVLRAAWKEADAGSRRIVLVSGEPGVGKTRLAAELCQWAHGNGGVVLAGRCDEELSVPFQPFVEALRHHVRHAPADALEGGLGPLGGELARLVPEVAERVPEIATPIQSDPDTERYRLFDAVVAWLSSLSAERTVVLLLDDLHWAARPTLLMLRHLMRAEAPLRLLVVGTYRDTDLDRSHPLMEMLADLRREQGVERVPLRGLDPAGVAAYLEAAAGHELDDRARELATAIHDETEGNPFFVGEILRHLRDTGAIFLENGRWTSRLSVDEVGIPEGIKEVVGRRLSRLSEVANAVLSVAAIVGAEFEVKVVEAAAGRSQDEVFGALAQAEEARLVEAAGTAPLRYRFAHALVRSTLYDELSLIRRVQGHRLVAEAIEAVHGGDVEEMLGELAHHWGQAAAGGDIDKAVEYARRAGDRAVEQHAVDEGVLHYDRALELLDAAGEPDDSARRIELLIRAGEAQRLAGSAEHRRTLLRAGELAARSGDGVAMARAALANSRGWWSLGAEIDADRVEALTAALDALDPAEAALRARLLATLAAELTFGDEEGRRFDLADEALEAARALGDPRVLADVLVRWVIARWTPDTLDRRRAAAQEIQGLARELGDPYQLCMGAVWDANSASETGDIEAFDRALETMQVLSAQIKQPTLRWMTAYLESRALLRRGDLEGAEQRAAEGANLGAEAGQLDAFQFYVVQTYAIRLEQGRSEELLPVGAAEARRTGYLPWRAVWVNGLAEDGHVDDARRELEPLLEGGHIRMSFDQVYLHAVALIADTAFILEHDVAASPAYEALAPYRDQLIDFGLWSAGAVEHFLAVAAATVGRHDDADAHFAAAVERHRRLGMPLHLSRSEARWGEALLRRGESERARELLSSARERAAGLGQGAVERRAARLLDRV